jgi:hypothetical protein
LTKSECGESDQRLARAHWKRCSNRHQGRNEAFTGQITSKLGFGAYCERMKATSSLIFATLALSACSTAPITVPVDPVEFPLPAAFPTLGQVVYPAVSASFQKSPVGFGAVSLTGNAAATGVVFQVKANIFARTTDPSDCTKVTVSTTSVYVCDASTQTKVSSQPITLAVDGSKTAFKLEDNKGVLKEAMTSGKLWVGLEFTEGLAANSKVKFSEMVASLAVF